MPTLIREPPVRVLAMGASSYNCLHDHANRPELATLANDDDGCLLAGNGHDVRVSPLKGKLLLATPPLVDPNFDRTVVLMLEHGDEGALGLVLNRPTDEDVEELLPNWTPLIT